MHVLVHEIQNSEPQGSKGGQGQQRGKMLQEHLEKWKRYHAQYIEADADIRYLPAQSG